jgi:hypothetical protein
MMSEDDIKKLPTLRVDGAEVVSEIMDLRPFMNLEFFIDKDHKEGALLRVSSPDSMAPEPEHWTAPTVDYLFDIAAGILTRLASNMREVKKNRVLADQLLKDIFTSEPLSSIFDAVTPRQES